MGNLHLENIYEDAYVQIGLDKVLSLLQLTFRQHPDTEQFRNGYRLAFDTATRKEIKYWVTDARQIKSMLPENQAWLVQNMSPLLKAQKIHKFAIIISPECFVMNSPNKTYDKANSNNQASDSSGVIKVHFDLESACNWLLSGEVVA